MNKNFMKTLLGTAAVATLAMVGPNTEAKADEFACSTAQLIVPWGPGGGTAVLFGLFENYINAKGAKPQIKVVTIPGQGGNKGAKEAIKKKADGCTLFAIHQSAIIGYLNKRVPFNWDGFDPVAHLTVTPSVLSASPKAPYKSIEDVLAAAKKNPGGIKVGATIAATSHFIWLLLGEKSGTKYSYVPVQGGTGKRKGLLLNNTFELAEMNEAAAGKELSTGTLRPLAIAAVKRSAALPNVPTLKEKGFDIVYALNRGIMVPKGTPKDKIDHWAKAFKQAVDDPEFQKKIAAKGTGLQYMGPEEYGKWFKGQTDLFSGLFAKIKK